MKKSLLAFTASLALAAGTVQAQSYGGPQHRGVTPMPRQATAYAAVAPDQILRQGIDRLKGFLSRGGTPTQEELEAFLNKEIAPYFDFEYMARWAAGRLQRNMTPEQKSEFADKLKGMFFAALARNLGTFSNPPPTIDIYPARGNRFSREVQVGARVTPKRGYPVRLQFRFYRGDQGWKVFDVTANGTSAVAYYRKHFNSMAGRPRR